jgi:hypothetical protein
MRDIYIIESTLEPPNFFKFLDILNSDDIPTAQLNIDRLEAMVHRYRVALPSFDLATLLVQRNE